MVEKVNEYPEIYKLPVELKGNALKVLNAYVVRSEGQYLLIDTGFNNDKCKKSLLSGLQELGLKPKDTSLFLTHFHADHIGLAELFIEEGESRIFMGRADYEYLEYMKHGTYIRELDELYIREGFPKAELEEQKKDNPARNYTTKDMFPARLLDNGDRFTIGKVSFECVEMSGHTPGHMCLYIREQQIMFLGDHILYDITPNVMDWPGMPDSLGRYLDNLNKIQRYPIRLALPGHRGGNQRSVNARAKELILHHEKRLQELKEILKGSVGMTAYKVASNMRWSLRGATWENAPKQQKWFAMGEAKSHLTHLLVLGEIVKEEKGKLITYRLL